MIYTAGSGFANYKDTQDALLQAFSAIAQSPLSSAAEKRSGAVRRQSAQ